MKQETEIRRDVGLLRSSLPNLPEPVAKPFLILVCGLPGTGKSWISHRLGERLALAVLETDALRKTLSPTPAYTHDENGRLFMRTHLLIEELLTKGISVLLDATNLVERYRQYLYSIVDRVNAKLVIVLTTAPRDVVRQRLRNRLGRLVQRQCIGRRLGSVSEDEREHGAHTLEPFRRGYIERCNPGYR